MTYSDDLALYIWNTSSPAYRDVTSSPTYLYFMVNNGASDVNASIKVPFAVLNLTLLPPLAKTPTAYFPCRALSLEDDTPMSAYMLGRAFLQQAFYAIDWNGLNMWLGQAPGPNVPSGEIQDLRLGLPRSETPWEDTWSRHLTPLVAVPSYVSSVIPSARSSSTPGPDTTPTTSSPKLSSGAKAGIGVGVVIGALGLLAFGVSTLRLRQIQALQQTNANKVYTSVAHRPRNSSGAIGVHEIDNPQTEPELEGEQVRANDQWRVASELAGGEQVREIDNWRVRPELPAGSCTPLNR